MAALVLFHAIIASLLLQVCCASHSGSSVAIRTHNAPGFSDADTHLAIRQNLASVQKREGRNEVFKGNVTLQKSWEDAVLLFLADEPEEEDRGTAVEPKVEIVCTKCYVNALATAELKFGPDFNVSKALEETVDEVSDAFNSLSEATVDWFETAADQTWDNITKDGFDFDDFTFPPFNVSLDMDIESTPDVSLQFSFEELELFMQVRTMLAANTTFTIPLYDSSTVAQLELGTVGMGLGVFFTVDLILDVKRPLDMTSGVHLKLDDGVSFTIDLFGDKPSDITVNGGQFEFLPVTVGADGASISAILRVGAHAGLKIEVPEIEAGLEIAVVADVAEIVTNITATPDDVDCKLSMAQEYSIALGAVAGASVVIHDATYGPVAATFTPIWYTTVTGMCASEARTTPAFSPIPTSQNLGRRDDLTSTSTTTEIIQTGVYCPQSLGPNCPNSLRSTTQYTETRTMTTALPSGVDPEFPTTVQDTISSMEAFGSNVLRVISSSGNPTSYVEPPPTATFSSESGDSAGDDEKKGDGTRGAACNVALSVASGLLALATITAFTL